MFREPEGLDGNYKINNRFFNPSAPPLSVIWETKKNYDLGSGLNQDKFVSNNQKFIIDTLNWLWENNQDLINKNTTSTMLNSGSSSILQPEIEDNHETWLAFLFLPAITNVFNKSGSAFMSQAANTLNTTISFNINNLNITNWINSVGIDLKVKLTDGVLKGIESIVQLSLSEGYNISEASFLLKEIIPVTPNEAKSLAKLYKTLKENPDITRQTRLMRVKAKANKFKKNRAKRIARTEIVRSKGKSEIEACDQLIKSGNLKTVKKTWISTNSRDNWDSTLMYDGKTIDLYDDFASNYGRPGVTTMSDFGYPSEINEYCILQYTGSR